MFGCPPGTRGGIRMGIDYPRIAINKNEIKFRAAWGIGFDKTITQGMSQTIILSKPIEIKGLKYQHANSLEADVEALTTPKIEN